MKKLTLTLLKLYRKFLSPKNFNLSTCRFTPSCSKYTRQAVQKYGVVKGLALGLWRVLRCNPLSKGGYDPVE
ncbi:membrane protein insertion efficiency factor YidD [candidate division WWE3 bacterium]|nr:membrane protein insertion efficiency factor YidD [candidate division WWE3 bacterium]